MRVAWAISTDRRMNTGASMKRAPATIVSTLALATSLVSPDAMAGSVPSFLRSWGEPGVGDGMFHGPGGIAIGPGGNVYVADGGNHCVHVFDSAGNTLYRWGTVGA